MVPFNGQLVTGCLERDPDARMDATQLLRTPFSKQFKDSSNLQILRPVLEKMEPIGKNAAGRRSADIE